MLSEFNGKVAVITGGGGVLCSTMAKALASQGAKVAVLDLKAENADKVAQEISAEGGVAKLTPESFCRYFKSRMKKTFSDFVLEIRVGHACKLLIEDNLNLKQICYESGFNNGVTFHRYFKRYTGLSPVQYQKEFGLKKLK